MEEIEKFTEYLKNEKDYSPNTLESYSFTFRDFFTRFKIVSNDTVRDYIQQLEDENKSPKTIRLRIACIEKIGEYKNVQLKIKRPKIRMSLSIDNIPNEEDFHTLIHYTKSKNKKLAFILELLGKTGARVSELLQFTYEQIQSGTCELKGKGNKYRRFFFTKDLQKFAKDKQGFVCTNRFNNRMTPRGLSSLIKDYGIKAGIEKKKLHPHAFRHFFAKMFLKKTNDVVFLADILGHSNLETTRLYLRKSYDEQQREIDRAVTW